MANKQIKDFSAVVTPAAADKLITQQDADNITRFMTVAQAVGAADPKAHAARHISAGADAFTSTQLLEALIKRIRESGGADLLVGAIADLELLGRSGTGIAGVAKATQAEAEAGTDNAKWMTALRAAQAIVALQRAISTQAEAEAGTDNTKDMTPLRTKQAITFIARPFTLGSPATATGTALDFTGIPSGVKMITISFIGVSLTGTDNIMVQLGDAGGFETTGYVGCAGRFDAGAQAVDVLGTSFLIAVGGAGATISGALTLVLENSVQFTWSAKGNFANPGDSSVKFLAGYKALSAELTQVRITRTGTDTFDAGELNILYA